MQENNTRECRKCLKTRVRVMAPVKTKKGHTHYLDENFRSWHGWTCSVCYGVQQQEYNKLRSFKVKAEPLSKNCCRKCNKKLPKSKYFFHDRCISNTEFSTEHVDYIYGW